jgi:hypothetical protein
MDTEVVRKERKKSRRAQQDTTAQEAQPTEYTNKVGLGCCKALEEMQWLMLYCVGVYRKIARTPKPGAWRCCSRR